MFPDQKAALGAEGIPRSLNDLSVETIAPSHYTGEVVTMILKEEWKKRYIGLNVGKELRVTGPTSSWRKASG